MNFSACTGKVHPDEYDIIDVILTFFPALKELSISCGHWYDKFSLRSQPYYSIKKLFQCSSRIFSKGHGKEFLTSGYSMSLTGVYCIKANLTKQIN